MKGIVLGAVIVVAAWLIGAGFGYARSGQVSAAAGPVSSRGSVTDPGPALPGQEAPSQLQAVLAGPRWRSAAIVDAPVDIPGQAETASATLDWSAVLDLTYDLLSEVPDAPRRVHISAQAQRHEGAGWLLQLIAIDDQSLTIPQVYHWQPGQATGAPEALDRVLASLGRSLNAVQQEVSANAGPQARAVIHLEGDSARYLLPAQAAAQAAQDGRYQVLSYHDLDEIALFPDGQLRWLRSLAEQVGVPPQHSALSLRSLGTPHSLAVPTGP